MLCTKAAGREREKKKKEGNQGSVQSVRRGWRCYSPRCVTDHAKLTAGSFGQEKQRTRVLDLRRTSRKRHGLAAARTNYVVFSRVAFSHRMLRRQETQETELERNFTNDFEEAFSDASRLKARAECHRGSTFTGGYRVKRQRKKSYSQQTRRKTPNSDEWIHFERREFYKMTSISKSVRFITAGALR